MELNYQYDSFFSQSPSCPFVSAMSSGRVLGIVLPKPIVGREKFHKEDHGKIQPRLPRHAAKTSQGSQGSEVKHFD